MPEKGRISLAASSPFASAVCSPSYRFTARALPVQSRRRPCCFYLNLKRAAFGYATVCKTMRSRGKNREKGRVFAWGSFGIPVLSQEFDWYTVNYYGISGPLLRDVRQGWGRIAKPLTNLDFYVNCLYDKCSKPSGWFI